MAGRSLGCSVRGPFTAGLEWALTPESTTSDADSQEGDRTLMRHVSPVKGTSQSVSHSWGTRSFSPKGEWGARSVMEVPLWP